jgi:hypothetical protein
MKPTDTRIAVNEMADRIFQRAGNDRLAFQVATEVTCCQRELLKQGAVVASNPERCTIVDRGKIVSSRNEEIVEIISPRAFTFKIPFH